VIVHLTQKRHFGKSVPVEGLAERHLGVNYRTAWHLCHRIREAMQDGGLLCDVVEAHHTYFSARKPRKGKPYVKKEQTDVVLGVIERGGKLA
jgi:hypothetical protein